MLTAEIKRNLQYLKVLKTQKQNMVAEQKELENQIAQLRKNPADKLTTDLYIFQYNKKIDGLKENISSTNKEIARVSQELDGVDLTELDDEDKEEYQEEIQELSPQEEPELLDVQPEEIKQEVAPKKQSNFKGLLLGYKNIPNLILLTILSVFSAWILYQIDASNMVSMVSTYTKFTVFAFLLVGIFSLLIVSFYLFKNIDSKPFGTFSDYFILYLSVVAVIIALFITKEFTAFKLVIVMGLTIYSLTFYVTRLALYGKNIKENISNKPNILRYYYSLFNKYSIIVLALIAIICGCSLFIMISYRVIPKWLSGTPTFFNSKLWIIIDFVLVGLALCYGLFFSIFRIKESDLKIIDLGCLTAQVISLEFFFLAIVRYSSIVGAFSYVFFALLFITATAISITRIIYFEKDKNEV